MYVRSEPVQEKVNVDLKCEILYEDHLKIVRPNIRHIGYILGASTVDKLKYLEHFQ